MFGNYVTVAVRNLLRQRTYTVINIVGLGIGLASCMLLLLYVQRELSYEQHHERAQQIHRVLRETRFDDGTVKTGEGTSGALAAALMHDFPEVEQAIRVMQLWGWIEHGEEGFSRPICVSDPGILEMFTYPLVRGDASTALLAPSSALISQSAARRYFGDGDPVGKVVRLLP